MTIADDIKTVLTADATLMALLTGGVWTGLREINRQEAAAAFDANQELKPCALIKQGAEMPRGPYHNSLRNGLVIYLYQRTGNATIEGAIDRTYALLHDKKIGSGTWAILHENTLHSYELEESVSALEANMAVMRFGQYRLR